MMQTVAHVHAVLQYIICSGVTSCALPVEALLSDVQAGQGDEIEVLRHRRLMYGGKKERRLNIGRHRAVELPRAGNQLADAVHAAESADVLAAQSFDAHNGDLRFIEYAAEGNVGRDDQLAADVPAVQILRGVGLGVAEGLRLLQRGEKAAAVAVHMVENVVCRTVHNAADTDHRLLLQRLFQVGKPGDSAAHRRRAAQRDAVFPRQLHQLPVVRRNEQLVGGDDVLARFQRGGDVFIGRVHPADGFDDHVHRGIGDDLRKLRRDGAGQLRPRPAAENVPDFHVASVLHKFVHSAADGAESQKADLHRFLHVTHRFFSTFCGQVFFPQKHLHFSEKQYIIASYKLQDERLVVFAWNIKAQEATG